MTKQHHQMSTKERFRRLYLAEKRKVQKWCDENNVKFASFSEASPTDICVVSENELVIGEMRNRISFDSGCYFIDVVSYDELYSTEWQQE